MIRLRVRCRGAVQGVGFRPTVWRLARDGGLRGDVDRVHETRCVRDECALGAVVRDKILEREAAELAKKTI